MKRNHSCSIFFVVAAIVGCSFGSGFAASPESRPDDFAVYYQLKTGSVPPPYYSEYTITISSSGKGEITLTPDYPADSVPQWTESFDLDTQTLDQFYQLLITEQTLSQTWQDSSQTKVGAPDEVVRITANNTQIEIPSQVTKNQNALKEKITKAIKGLVPEALWNSLKQRHLTYAKTHYPSGAK